MSGTIFGAHPVLVSVEASVFPLTQDRRNNISKFTIFFHCSARRGLTSSLAIKSCDKKQHFF